MIPKIVVRCALSYVRCSCGQALCAGFRWSSHRATPEPKGCRIWGRCNAIIQPGQSHM